MQLVLKKLSRTRSKMLRSVCIACGLLLPIKQNAVANVVLPPPDSNPKITAPPPNQALKPLFPRHVQLDLPQPESAISLRSYPKHLSLKEAINLALRNNPQVLSADMQVILDKFDLEIAYNKYAPQPTLELGTSIKQNSPASGSITPGAKMLLPTNGTLSFDYTGSIDPQGNVSGDPALNYTQPLLKGAGNFIYKNGIITAKEAYYQSKLDYRDSIISIVTTIMSDYRSLVTLLSQETINKRTIANQKSSIKLQQLQVKLGRLAENNLLQTQQNLLEIKQDTLANTRNLQESEQQLLTDLGLSPTSNISVDKTLDMTHTNIPDQKTCEKIAFTNNTSYLKKAIALRQQIRALKIEKNEQLWDLSLTAGTTLAKETNPPYDTSGVSESKVGLNLTVPLGGEQLSNKKDLIVAKINLIQARRDIYTAKLEVRSQIKTFFQKIENDKQQIAQDKLLIKINAKTIKGTEIQYRYGKINASELTQQITKNLKSKIDLTSAQAAYLNDIADLRKYLGITLKEWGIKLRR